MKFISVLAAFFILLIAERGAVPALIGVFIPLSFWFSILGLLYLERNQGLWFALLAGALFSWAQATPVVWPFIIFPGAAALFFFMRRIFGNDEIVGDIAASAAAVFSMNFFQLPAAALFDAERAAPYSLARGDFFMSLAFFALLAVVIFFVHNSKARDRLTHI